MSELVRFGISIDSKLLAKFDKRNRSKGYANRSEAIRDLIRDCLVAEEWEESDREMIGVVSLVFDHHKLELPKNITVEQHKNHKLVVSSTHIHLDSHNCLEVVIMRGKGNEIRRMAELLISRRGIKHGKLSITTTGKELS